MARLFFLGLYGLLSRGARSLRWDSTGGDLVEKNAVSLSL
jgi:hypothetical protein